MITVGLGVFCLGCDQTTPVEANRSPSVFGLEVTPDSINAADVPPGQVNDSLAAVEFQISTRAEDVDGSVERVVFTVEPATNPRSTATGTLEARDGGQYARRLALRVPVDLDEIYTVRVFAVDDDSLASNQNVGRFRFVPES